SAPHVVLSRYCRYDSTVCIFDIHAVDTDHTLADGTFGSRQRGNDKETIVEPLQPKRESSEVRLSERQIRVSVSGHGNQLGEPDNNLCIAQLWNLLIEV